MKIRKATLKDCKVCYNLSRTKELLAADGKPIPLSYFKEIVGTQTIFLVAEENGEIIGYSSADLLPGKVAMWWLLSVSPPYQNQGVGKKLASEIEKECRKNEIKFLIGYAPQFNKKTLTFHKNNGFILGEKMIEILKVLN